MKKLLLVALTTLSLYAEATFEQVQSMIGSVNSSSSSSSDSSSSWD